MTTTYLPERVQLKLERESVEAGGTTLYYHLRKLFGQIEELFSSSNKEVNNVLITGGAGQIFYFGLPADDGTYPVNTIRIDTSNNTFHVEQQISLNNWVTLLEQAY